VSASQQHAKDHWVRVKESTNIDKLVGHCIKREAAPSCKTWQHTRSAQPHLTFAFLTYEDVLGKTIKK